MSLKFSNTKKIFTIIFFLSLIFILTIAASNKVYVYDSLGRRVEIRNYKAIGILNPAVIKTLHIANYDFKNIKGVDSFSATTYKSFFKNTPEIIGDYNGPNIEKIVKSNIDLLIIDKSFSLSKLNEIKKLGINYYVYSPETYNKVVIDLKNLLKLFKIELKYKSLYQRYISYYNNKIYNLNIKKGTIIAIVWYDKNFMLAGDDSFIASFLKHYGFQYAIKDKGWPKISNEKFIKLNPDYIIVASSYISKNIFKKSIFKNLKAIRTNKIFFFDSKIENMVLQPSFDTFKGFYLILKSFK